MPHPGLGGEMNNPGKVAVGGNQGKYGLAVGDIEAGKTEPGSIAQFGEPRLFVSWVVLGVEIAPTHAPVAAFEPRLGGVKADKAAPPGYHDPHGPPVNLPF